MSRIPALLVTHADLGAALLRAAQQIYGPVADVEPADCVSAMMRGPENSFTLAAATPTRSSAPRPAQRSERRGAVPSGAGPASGEMEPRDDSVPVSA